MGEYEVEITQSAGGYWSGKVFHVHGSKREEIGGTRPKEQRNEAVAEAGRIAKVHKGPEIEKLSV
jgi:hypothetical protein